MEKSDFFSFGSKGTLSNFFAIPIELKKGVNGIFDEWNLIDGKYIGIDFPVIFKQDKYFGKKITDIMDTGWPSFYLISDRMKIALEGNNLTGWKTYPIKLYDKKGNEIFGYHGFSVIGKSGPINYEKSQIIDKQFVPAGPICKYYKGKSVKQWDGSDFFRPEGSGGIFITKKAADVLKENKITNVQFINLADTETAIGDVQKNK